MSPRIVRPTGQASVKPTRPGEVRPVIDRGPPKAAEPRGTSLMLKLIRTTIIGGIIFLVPIAIFVAVIGKGLEITGAIAKPIAHVLPVNMIGGFAVAQGLAILLLVLILPERRSRGGWSTGSKPTCSRDA
jgi:hypothetical protein